MALLDQLWFQNTLVLIGYALVASLLSSATKGERWQAASSRLKRDYVGIAAFVVIVLFVFIGSMEMIRLPSNEGRRTLLDLVTTGIPQEKEYAAPMATHAFSVANPRPLNGRHLLGTDTLGRDTLVQTLRATRTALIIGGLTSIIYIPIGVSTGSASADADAVRGASGTGNFCGSSLMEIPFVKSNQLARLCKTKP